MVSETWPLVLLAITELIVRFAPELSFKISSPDSLAPPAVNVPAPADAPMVSAPVVEAEPVIRMAPTPLMVPAPTLRSPVSATVAAVDVSCIRVLILVVPAPPARLMFPLDPAVLI